MTAAAPRSNWEDATPRGPKERRRPPVIDQRLRNSAIYTPSSQPAASSRKKNGPAVVWHPLEEATADGTVQFYVDAEAVSARLPRRGPPLVLQAKRNGNTGPFKPNRMAKLVRKLADTFGLPATFTLDACRHGGMTELEEGGIDNRAGWGALRASD